MNLEDDLRALLRREPPPADFAAKVLSLTAGRPRPVSIWRRPLSVALAAGLAAATVVPVAYKSYQRREEMRAQEAGRELLLALNITRAKLTQVREKVRRETRNAL